MNPIVSCPVCSSSRLTHHFTGRTTRRSTDPILWRVDKCADCDHRFMNPRPTWDELAPYYNDNYAPYRPDHCATDDDQAMADAARQRGSYRHLPLPVGKHVLDLGCGGGHFLRICRLLGAASVTGIEPSDIGAAAARASGLNVHSGTMDSFVNTTNPPPLFDLITANHVIEHVPNPVETLRLMRQVLADNGLIWIAVPNSACRSAETLGARWHSADIPLHLMHFSPQSLRQTAKQASLTVKRLYTYSLPLAVRASLQSEWRSRWHIPFKLSALLISPRRAQSHADRLDHDNQGEAIICELTKS